jgi:hypothetical protein
MTNASMFAYAADAAGRLEVIQLTSPETNPQYLGWAARPTPVLIATKKLPGTPMAITEGLQRDRGVDESGNQLSVFNRVGSRPMNKAEAERLYKLDGQVFTVGEKPPSAPNHVKGTVPQELLDSIAELKKKVAKEGDDDRKARLQKQLDALNKQALEAAKDLPEPPTRLVILEQIRILEDKIRFEKFPARRKQQEEELLQLQEQLKTLPE